MTSAPTPEALRTALAVVLCDCLRYDRERGIIIGIGDAADALIAGPLAPILKALADVEKERDELLGAAGFKPGPFPSELSRKVILDDIAGMRPEMVKARRRAERVQSDADLWTMRMLEEWPGDTLLIRLWRQRKEATKKARATRAECDALKGEVERLKALLQPIQGYAKVALRPEIDIGEGEIGEVIYGGLRHSIRTQDLRAIRDATLATENSHANQEL